MQKTANLFKYLKSLRFRFGAMIVAAALVPAIIVATCILTFYEARALVSL